MSHQPLAADNKARVAAGQPFVEALARRVASSMPHSIDLCDLVQDGMIGLIDAAHRYDEGRGIKFETFAERRVRGAMIDALRRDAWPRGVRRVRRELEAAREDLRRELGCEPSLSDLAARVGLDEARLGRTIVRINTIESTSPLAADRGGETCLPPSLVPSEPPSPDRAYEAVERRARVRAAIAGLPWRERKVIGLYYFGEVTMKQIGAEIGVNESRVSQLHARAVQRLRRVLEHEVAAPRTQHPPTAVVKLTPRANDLARVKVGARDESRCQDVPEQGPAVVLPYPRTSRTARRRSASLNGFDSHRHPVSSRKRSVSCPATAPVTNTTRRASSGAVAAMAR